MIMSRKPLYPAFAAVALAGLAAAGVAPLTASEDEAAVNYRVIRGSPAALKKHPKGSTIPGDKVICLTSPRDFLFLVSTQGKSKTIAGPECGKVLAMKDSRNQPAVSAGAVR